MEAACDERAIWLRVGMGEMRKIIFGLLICCCMNEATSAQSVNATISELKFMHICGNSIGRERPIDLERGKRACECEWRFMKENLTEDERAIFVDVMVAAAYKHQDLLRAIGEGLGPRLQDLIRKSDAFRDVVQRTCYPHGRMNP
jgi:hypothetical protein